MRCPTLRELPSPPAGKTGWPWTEETPQLPDQMPDGSDWPKISIVTPSYNYGRFIEETIRSVLLQGYPNLEYIIIDGSSTDESVEIIKQYEPWITYWVSEPDRGQTDAINKGHEHCTGDIFVWINSDDSYNPSVLETVSSYFAKGYQIIAGSCLNLYNTGDSKVIRSIPTKFSNYLRFWNYQYLPQPSVFIGKEITDSCFPLDISLYWVMDYQLFLRALRQKPRVAYIDCIWTVMKYHGENKTLSTLSGELQELYRVSLAEIQSLPFVRKKIHEINLEDCMALKVCMSSDSFPSVSKVLLTLINRPTLLHWPLFWKVLTKSILGPIYYSELKKAFKMPDPIR